MSASASPSREKYQALLSSASKTAGSDNWRVTSGRIDGPDGFVIGDAWRLAKLQFKSTKPPQSCPVCLDKPSDGDSWYVTKSCKHYVCRSCLQQYAANQISDPNHTGPLKCPCCPRLLRVDDAKVALDKLKGGAKLSKTSSAKAVIKRVASKKDRGRLFVDENDGDFINNSALEHLIQWDNKTRDEFLRSMNGFRPCPHCSEDKATNIDGGNISEDRDNNKSGGGFVTPECLAPLNDERERKAELLLKMAGPPTARAILLAYTIYYLRCTSNDTETDGRQTTAIVQIVKALVPSVLLPILPQVIRFVLAWQARREILRPIIVTCPECEKDFPLLASSEFQLADASSDTAAESATLHWKNSNTRPCPGCASPIMKDGGCNHVKCGKCRTDFCWACMRPKSRCHAYQCKNGAPYGNAFGDGSLMAVRAGLEALERERQAGQTLIERIDNLEALALRNLRLFNNPFGFVALVGALCLSVIDLSVGTTLWIGIARLISVTSRLLTRTFSLAAQGFIYLAWRLIGPVIMYVLITSYTQQRRHNRGPNVINARRENVHTRFRSEEEQLAEAIARSLVDQ